MDIDLQKIKLDGQDKYVATVRYNREIVMMAGDTCASALTKLGEVIDHDRTHGRGLVSYFGQD